MADFINQRKWFFILYIINRAKMSLQTETPPTKIFSLSERLTIIEELIEELRPDNLLKVLINDDPMLPHPGNFLITLENTK